jgi:hypothetical protein
MFHLPLLPLYSEIEVQILQLYSFYQRLTEKSIRV